MPPVHISFKPPKAPSGAPKLGEIHIKPAKNGIVVSHYGPPGSSKEFHPDTFVFPHIKGAPAIKPLINHLVKHGHKLWLGGKTMEPRMPGAGKEKRLKQVEASSYPGAKGGF